VFCWDVRKQSEPLLTIRVSDKVQDLFVVKERPKQGVSRQRCSPSPRRERVGVRGVRRPKPGSARLTDVILDKLVKVAVIVLAASVLVGVAGYFLRPKPQEPSTSSRTSRRTWPSGSSSHPRDCRRPNGERAGVKDVLLVVLHKATPFEDSFTDLLTTKITTRTSTGSSSSRTPGQAQEARERHDLLGQVQVRAGRPHGGREGPPLRRAPEEHPPDRALKSLADAKEVLRAIKKASPELDVPDAIMLIDVKDFNQGDEDGYEAKVTVQGEIDTLDPDETVATMPPVSASIDSKVSYLYIHNWLSSANFFLRFLLWFLATAALPFLLIQLVRAVLSRRKERAQLHARGRLHVLRRVPRLGPAGVGLAHARDRHVPHDRDRPHGLLQLRRVRLHRATAALREGRLLSSTEHGPLDPGSSALNKGTAEAPSAQSVRREQLCESSALLTTRILARRADSPATAARDHREKDLGRHPCVRPSHADLMTGIGTAKDAKNAKGRSWRSWRPWRFRPFIAS